MIENRNVNLNSNCNDAIVIINNKLGAKEMS